MKKIALAVAMSALALSSQAIELKNDDQKISYTIGTQMGAALKENVQGPIQLDEKAFFEAVSDVIHDKELQLKQEEMGEVMQKFMAKAQDYGKKKYEEIAKQNQEEAKKLLAENQKKEGVTVTKSGLQYRVIKQGKGKKPTADSIVKVHYQGTLADGSEFDSSVKQGKPVEFPLNGVIKGWSEGLQLMNEGSTYEFVIPAELAYGKQAPTKIGPDRALIFQVELLTVKTRAEVEAEAEKALAKMKQAQKQAKKAKKTVKAEKEAVEKAKETVKAEKKVVEKAKEAVKSEKAAVKTVVEKAKAQVEAKKAKVEPEAKK